MAMTMGGQGGPSADINVTPLIDVLLVLLVIFMLVAPAAPTVLDASVPEPGPPPPPGTVPGLVLEVRADDFALNRTPVLTREQLAVHLREAFETHRDAALFVRVADGVVYDRVIEALDAARGAGAARIGLMTTPSGE